MANVRVPIDRGWAWVITFACGGLFCWVTGNEKNGGIIIVELMETYPEKSATSVLWVFSLSRLVNMISGPLNGILLAKTSTRFVGMLGVGIMTASLVAFAYVPTIEYMYLVYGVLYATGSGMILLIIFTAFAPYFEKKNALSLGLTSAGSGLGMVINSIALRALFDNYSFSGAMILYAGICAQAMVLASLLRPISYYTKWVKSANTVDSDNIDKQMNGLFASQDKMRERSFSLGANNQQRLNPPDSISTFHSAPNNIHNISADRSQLGGQQLTSLQILTTSLQAIEGSGLVFESNHSKEVADLSLANEDKDKNSFNWRLAYNPLCLMIGFAILSYCSGINNVLQCIPPLGKEIGLTKEFVSIMLAVTGAVEIPMRIFNGWFADKKFLSAPVHVAICMIFTGITAFLCATLYSTAGIVAMLMGITFAGTSVFSLMPIVYADLFGKENIQSVTAIIFVYMGLSNIVSTFSAGGIYEATKQWNNVYYFTSALTAIGGLILLIVVLAIRRKRKQKEQKLEG